MVDGDKDMGEGDRKKMYRDSKDIKRIYSTGFLYEQVREMINLELFSSLLLLTFALYALNALFLSPPGISLWKTED